MVKSNIDDRNHAGKLIHMLSHQLKRQSASYELDCGLTTAQKHVLEFILFRSLEGNVYQKDIEENFRIRRSSASGMLQLLEKNGFIRRENVKQDARLKKIVPTKKAEALRDIIQQNINEMEAQLREGIPEVNFTIGMDVLRQMLYNLSKNENSKTEPSATSNGKDNLPKISPKRFNI